MLIDYKNTKVSKKVCNILIMYLCVPNLILMRNLIVAFDVIVVPAAAINLPAEASLVPLAASTVGEVAAVRVELVIICMKIKIDTNLNNKEKIHWKN